MNATLYNSNGEKQGTIDIPEEIFGIEPNEGLLHQYAVTYEANQRQGTHKAKTRSEVSGGGKKPWKQKGTGRARVGSSRNPLWKHGGVSFAPVPRDYRKKFPKKMRRLAIFSILSDRASEGKVSIIESPDFENPSSAKFRDIMNKTGIDTSILYVTANSDRNLYLSGRNLENVSVTHMGELNPYQVLSTENVLISTDALNIIKELWLR